MGKIGKNNEERQLYSGKYKMSSLVKIYCCVHLAIFISIIDDKNNNSGQMKLLGMKNTHTRDTAVEKALGHRRREYVRYHSL